MKHRLKIIAAALALALPAAQAQDLFSRNKPIDFEFLQEISASATIGKHPIIPTGKPHRLLFLEAHESTGLGSGLPLGSAWLADLEGDKAVALIYTLSNLAQNIRIGEPNEELCQGDDLIWKRSSKGRFSDVNCATLRHYVYPFLRNEGDLGDIVSKLKSREIELPSEVIEIGLSRHMEQGRVLLFRIYLNPRALGQDFRSDMRWSPNYLSEGLHDDPGKQAIIERLKSWATQAQDRMSQALFLKADAFKDLPDLIPAMKSAKPE